MRARGHSLGRLTTILGDKMNTLFKIQFWIGGAVFPGGIGVVIGAVRPRHVPSPARKAVLRRMLKSFIEAEGCSALGE